MAVRLERAHPHHDHGGLPHACWRGSRKRARAPTWRLQDPVETQRSVRVLRSWERGLPHHGWFGMNTPASLLEEAGGKATHPDASYPPQAARPRAPIAVLRRWAPAPAPGTAGRRDRALAHALVPATARAPPASWHPCPARRRPGDLACWPDCRPVPACLVLADAPRRRALRRPGALPWWRAEVALTAPLAAAVRAANGAARDAGEGCDARKARGRHRATTSAMPVHKPTSAVSAGSRCEPRAYGVARDRPARGNPLREFVLGTQAERLIRLCRVPVLVVKRAPGSRLPAGAGAGGAGPGGA